MKPYDSYFFDNDGTLFDTVDLICTCFQYVAEKNAGKTMDKGTIFVTWSHAELSSLPVYPT